MNTQHQNGPTKTHRIRRAIGWSFVGFVVVVVVVGVASAAGNKTTLAPLPVAGAQSAAGATAAPVAGSGQPIAGTPAPANSAPADGIADGTYEVGTDVTPGKYKTTGPTTGLGAIGMCYWERTGKDGSIIANNVGKGPDVVTIKAGDGSFKTTGCEPWHKS